MWFFKIFFQISIYFIELWLIFYKFRSYERINYEFIKITHKLILDSQNSEKKLIKITLKLILDSKNSEKNGTWNSKKKIYNSTILSIFPVLPEPPYGLGIDQQTLWLWVSVGIVRDQGNLE